MINQTLGHYLIVEQIGSGGMGVVYRARDLQLDRDVALKVLPSGTLSDEAARKQFRKEALALAKLNHPNIETIHEFDTQDGVDFLVMELIQGTSLAERLRARALPEKEVIAAGAQIAAALEEAHEHGVVHRDLKPGNIFLSQKGLVKVLDFGLARFLRPEKAPDLTASITAVPALAGTLPYMAPEQLRGEPADQRSDLYAAGTVLYEMATGLRPFREEMSTRLADAILHQPPVSPRAMNARVSPDLERIILKCLDKEPTSRYQSAKELEVDLRRLERDTDSVARAAAATSSPGPPSAPLLSRASRLSIVAGAALLIILAAGVSWWVLRRATGPRTRAGQTTIAVLPFQNLGADANADYLRFALADQVTNTLSYTPALAIRPFAMSRKYAGQDVDPQAAGREMRVADIVTGHFLQEGDRMQVSLEVIDVEGNSVLWRDTVETPAQNRIEMQAQLAARVRQGVATRLGATSSALFAGRTQPKNAEAYDLYLHAIALQHDPAPNKQAIALLERAVALDAGYAPAWAALAFGYSYDEQYSIGGEDAFRHSEAALVRALALDPDLIDAAAGLVGLHVERAKLISAIDEAEAILKRRPDSAYAHFTRSYVLRYAGLLDESASECDAAFALDPTDYRLRSCALVFINLDRPERAMDFIRLDLGSEWSISVAGDISMRQGKMNEVLTLNRKLSTDSRLARRLLQACVEHRPAAEIDRLTREDLADLATVRDGEYLYNETRDLAVCGKREEALQNLRRAIDCNYCAYPVLDTEPTFANLRRMPEFAALRAAAMECQKKFLAHRGSQPR